MAGGASEQIDMATTLNQFSQTMTQSQTQIQLIQDAIIQLANGAQIQAQSNQQMVHDMALIKNQLQSHITPPPPLLSLLPTLLLLST